MITSGLLISFMVFVTVWGYYDEVEWRKCTSLKLIDQYNLFQYVTFNKDGTGKWLDTEPKQAYVDYDFYEYDVCIYKMMNDDGDMPLVSFKHRKTYKQICSSSTECRHYISRYFDEFTLEDRDYEISQQMDDRLLRLEDMHSGYAKFHIPGVPKYLSVSSGGRLDYTWNSMDWLLLPFSELEHIVESAIKLEPGLSRRRRAAAIKDPVKLNYEGGELFFTNKITSGISEFEIKVFGFYLDVTPDEFGKPVFEEKTAITIGIPNTDLYVWLPRQGAYVPTDGSWKENGQINTYTTAAVGDFSVIHPRVWNNSTIFQRDSANMTVPDDRMFCVETVGDGVISLYHANDKGVWGLQTYNIKTRSFFGDKLLLQPSQCWTLRILSIKPSSDCTMVSSSYCLSRSLRQPSFEYVQCI